MMLAIAFTAINCSKHVSSCINEKINDIKAEAKRNPAAEIKEYEYNGQKVYLFNSNCCDQYNVVYDKNCNAICAPSGGFAGSGDLKCKDFFEVAKFIRVVWKDNR
jgi:hypothetical protein